MVHVDGALKTWVARENTSKSSLIPPRNSEEEEESGEMDSSISGAEVVKKLLGSRGPRMDENHPEFIKALDVDGLSWFI